MFIRFCIKLAPILLASYVYCAEQDSATIYLNLGLQQENEGKLKFSEYYYKKALNISTDSISKAKINNILGIIYAKQGKYNLAISTYTKAEELIADKNNSVLLNILGNKAIIYKVIGDYNKALLYNQKAFESTNDNKQKAFIINNIANIYYKQNNYHAALQNYKESLNIKTRINDKEIYSTYLNIALCYKELGDNKKAEKYFNKTIQERIKLYGEKHYRLILTYLYYGDFLIKTSPEKSLQLLSIANALAISNYGGKHPETAKTWMYLGNYYLSKKEYENALEHYQQATIANSKGFDDMDIYQNPTLKNSISELQQLEILHQKAIAFQKYAATLKNQDKELEISLATYELAIETLFKLQNSFMDESKRTLIANKKSMFAEAANVAIQLKNYPEAFRLIERGKASTLLAAINNNQAIKFGDIPDSLVEQENEYKRLQFVYSASENTDSSLYYQAKYDSLTAYFEARYPKYHQLKYSQKIIDPCKQLDTNQVLLEYALTDTLCITLVVTNEGYRHYSFSVDSVFYKNIETFAYHLRKVVFHKEYKEQYQKITSSGYYLWEKLIKPLNIPEGKSLVIIPDGILSYINFEVLLYNLQEDVNMNYYLLKYLIYKHPVSYSYSANWLFEPFDKKPKRNIGAFAVDYKDREDLLSLLYSVPEAKEITKSFRGKAYINKECTREAFFTNAGNYKIIHLSLHGDIDMGNPNYSKLGFYDNDLYAWEVYGMNLNARLAYLSACNTGDGKLDKGEGVFSMGRAFAYAGCPTIVMSLWAEKDNLSHVTIDFYKYLRKGYPLDKAMQLAKINHLKQKFNAHPHFWANKVIMGKTGPIKCKNGFYWVFVILIIPVLFFLYKKRVN